MGTYYIRTELSSVLRGDRDGLEGVGCEEGLREGGYMYTYSLFHFVIERKLRQHIPQIKQKKSMVQSRLKFLLYSGPFRAIF